MTTLTLNYEFRRSDLGPLVASQIGSRSFLIRRLIGSALLVYGVHRVISYGFDWWTVFLAYVVIWAFIPCLTIRIIAWLLFCITGTQQCQLKVDDSGVSEKTNRNFREIPWWSFTLSGGVYESPDYFRLHASRGDFFLPKRAFAGKSDLTAFRAVFHDKLGDRCHFVEQGDSTSIGSAG